MSEMDLPPENSSQAEEPEINDTDPLELEVSNFVSAPPEILSRAEDPEVNDTDPLKLEVSNLDPAFLGTLEPCEEQKNGDPKENGEDPSNQLVLQDLKKELCRLCGKKGPSLMPIFNTTSCAPNGEITLPDKIESYLPLKVKMEDPLPSHICIRCSELLSRWHELYLTCVAADVVLWKTFGGESDVSSHSSSNRNQENAAQCADNATEQKMDTENCESLNKANEEHEVLCSVCGMNTPSNPAKEDDSLIEEFEKFCSEVPSFKYKCRYCCEHFSSSNAKKEHFINCRELSTLCEYCGKKGLRRKNIQKHINIKHQGVVIKHICDKCGKSFKSKAVFQKHYSLVHVQSIEKKFCCYLCCTAYVDEKMHQSHMEKHEAGEIKTVFQIEKYLDGEVYVCPVCKEIFIDAESLVVHLTVKKEVKCPSCLKRMPSEKKLLFHTCKTWNCRYCPKTYKKKSQCVIHERIHIGDKPIQCRTCDRRFQSYQQRACHETTHAPLFSCVICNKRFKYRSVYQDHLQLHVGLDTIRAPLCCTICKKKFHNADLFQDHLLWHEGKVFMCSLCGQKSCMRRHIKKHVSRTHKGINVNIVISNI